MARRVGSALVALIICLVVVSPALADTIYLPYVGNAPVPTATGLPPTITPTVKPGSTATPSSTPTSTATPTDTATPSSTPTSTPTGTPVIVTNALVNGDFEQGADVGWVRAGGGNIINDASLARTGSWSALLGGANRADETITQLVTIPANAPYLVYWYTATSGQANCFIDAGYIWVDTTPNDATIGTIVGSVYDFCQEKRHTDYRKGTVDLRAYAGQTVSLQFDMSTDAGIASYWNIDDVVFQSTP